MSLLTNITQAQIDASQTELDGKIPDATSAAGHRRGGARLCRRCGYRRKWPGPQERAACPLTGICSTPRPAMPAACGARRVAGSEVVGFSKELPGRYDCFPVDLGLLAIGPTQALGLDARPLTYGELADRPGGYGTVPYGATGPLPRRRTDRGKTRMSLSPCNDSPTATPITSPSTMPMPRHWKQSWRPCAVCSARALEARSRSAPRCRPCLAVPSR